MKFTASVAMVDPSFYAPLARAAEEAGYDGISVPDSICYPRESESRYPYTPDGSREFLENKPFVEPMVAIATMAAVTERIGFYTSVTKLPIRHPVIFAKEVTSLAVITGNRFHLGVGTSPWPDDYEVVGLPWEGRSRRFDECIAIIRGLAGGDYFEYHGRFYEVPPIKLNPAPSGPVKILVGGHSEALLRRAAAFGDGWIGAGMAFDELARVTARLRELRLECGRGELPFEIHATGAESFTADGVRRLAELGVTHTGGGFGRFSGYQHERDTETLQEKVDALRRYADEVIAEVRG
ncbi:MAG TPA: TIGR03619 family F420-dependent LLM class oxidoreductase [Acidimicrobiales bacterium]|nr:TIGR03619 family F420-dependent LLM class oxidoreductase [Acidimicrobiales bacterium]